MTIFTHPSLRSRKPRSQRHPAPYDVSSACAPAGICTATQASRFLKNPRRHSQSLPAELRNPLAGTRTSAHVESERVKPRAQSQPLPSRVSIALSGRGAFGVASAGTAACAHATHSIEKSARSFMWPPRPMADAVWLRLRRGRYAQDLVELDLGKRLRQVAFEAGDARFLATFVLGAGRESDQSQGVLLCSLAQLVRQVECARIRQVVV